MSHDASQQLLSAWQIVPHFPCSSIEATIHFYTERLHFTLGGVHPDHCPREDASTCSIFAGHKAAANIYLFKTTPPFQPTAAMVAMGTKQLDQYYEALKAEGKVEISMPIEDKPWGYRQFEVRHVDGNRIQFFRFLEGGNPGTDNGGDASLAGGDA